MKKLRLFLSLMMLGFGVAGCSSNTDNLASSSENNEQPETQAPMSSGIAKGRMLHVDQHADVTKWMDKASTKTPAQIASEAKLARELKEAQEQKEARLAQEAKLLAAKAVAQKNSVSNSALAATSLAQNQAQQHQLTNPAVNPANSVNPVANSKPLGNSATVSNNNSAEALHTETITDKTPLKLVSSVKPKFPLRASLAGLSQGTVTARLVVEADGKVSKVDIVKAKPAQYFNEEVIAAASKWKYNATSRQHTITVDFTFDLEES